MLSETDLFDLDHPGSSAAALTKEALDGAQELMGVAFDALPIALLFHTAQGILFANSEACSVFGTGGTALIGQHLLDYVDTEDAAAVASGIEATLSKDKTKILVEALFHGKDGVERLCRMTMVRLPWPGNPMIQVVVNDVTDQRRAEASLRQLTITDELTGAYNRRHAFYEGSLYVGSFIADGSAFSVALLDIDHFKRVNDTFGHAAGDQVLQALTSCAHTFLPTIRMGNSAMFARIGGEEFVLLLPGIGLSDAIATADRLRRRVERLPVVTNAGVVNLTISIGVGTMSAADQSFDALLARADAALYRAKTEGRNRVASAV
jgi:diguanylate cyclase (GGDEF)-like protein/PAS domain S-box-containing protein